jgi:hypothetical protein
VSEEARVVTTALFHCANTILQEEADTIFTSFALIYRLASEMLKVMETAPNKLSTPGVFMIII